MQHKWVVLGVVFGVFLGLAVYLLALTQLDLLVAPYVWANIHRREIFSLPGVGAIYAWSSEWYNLLLWISGLGLVIVMLSLLGLWWFWEDSENS